MNKYEAIQDFMSSFGLKAYEIHYVPDNAKLPYLTYSAEIGKIGEETSFVVNLWYKTTRNDLPNSKVDEIDNALKGGAVIDCAEGAIWIKKGSPFCQNMIDENDSSIKRRYINLSAEFIML